jgi:hypothetical protein
MSSYSIYYCKFYFACNCNPAFRVYVVDSDIIGITSQETTYASSPDCIDIIENVGLMPSSIQPPHARVHAVPVCERIRTAAAHITGGLARSDREAITHLGLLSGMILVDGWMEE